VDPAKDGFSIQKHHQPYQQNSTNTIIMAAIETTAFFKLGPRPLDDHSLENVLDE
jgi:hypothetical protein